MLNLIFQRNKAKNPDKVWVDSRGFFDTKVNDDWFKDEFVRNIIESVDKAKVIEGCVLKDFEGKIIPPQFLSTGTKTAICVYLFPDLIFNATQMGDNALAFILKLAENRDITLLTYRDMPYNVLNVIGFTKDYLPVEYEDDVEYWELFDLWKEEMFND